MSRAYLTLRGFMKEYTLARRFTTGGVPIEPAVVQIAYTDFPTDVPAESRHPASPP